MGGEKKKDAGKRIHHPASTEGKIKEEPRKESNQRDQEKIHVRPRSEQKTANNKSTAPKSEGIMEKTMSGQKKIMTIRKKTSRTKREDVGIFQVRKLSPYSIRGERWGCCFLNKKTGRKAHTLGGRPDLSINETLNHGKEHRHMEATKIHQERHHRKTKNKNEETNRTLVWPQKKGGSLVYFRTGGEGAW